MQRWINRSSTLGENPKVDAFLAELVAVCRKHNLSVSHEDYQGGFEVAAFSEKNVAWLLDAADATDR